MTDIKILLFLLSIIMPLSLSYIKLIPLEDYNFCFTIFNQKQKFIDKYLSYSRKEKTYIIRTNDYYISDKEIVDLFHLNETSKYIILKDNSLIYAKKQTKNSKEYLILYYYEFPPNKYYINEQISENNINDFYIIDCSNMIFIYVFGLNYGTILYIFDNKLQKLFLKKKINDYSINSIIGIYLDKNRNNIMICETYFNMECYIIKYDKKLITGEKLKIFSEYSFTKTNNEYSIIHLVENNKILVGYLSGFEIYYSIITYDGIFLKFSKFKNEKIKNGYKTTLNLCREIINNYNDNNNLKLFYNFEDNYNNKGIVINSILDGSCNSIDIHEVNINQNYKIDFKNIISDEIYNINKKIYFTYINNNIDLYKNNKRISIFSKFDKNDEIFVKFKGNDEFFLLKYNYGEDECYLRFYSKINYIYISGVPHICKMKTKLNEINNIIYNELDNKIFNLNSTEFNFSIIFENKIEKNDLIIYFLNKEIYCKKDMKNKNKVSFIERILNNYLAYKIGNIFDKIKAFFESFKPYIYNFIILKSKKYKKYIFGFPGTTGIKQLLFECLGYSLEIFDSKEPNIKVEKFFLETFKLLYKDLFSNKIINELKLNSDYQVIFTGHSLGGAIATLSSYYFAKNKISTNEPILITFGQPRVGNEEFAKNYMKLIPQIFRVARKGDLVTVIPPAKELKDLKCFGIFNIINLFKNSISKDIRNFYDNFKLSKNIGNKIGIFFELLFKIFSNLIQFTFYFVFGILLKLNIFPFPSGYCHIGGLYLLIDDKFYQCNDFYNQQTNHPICDNWEFETIYDLKNILDNHSYLRLGESLIGKCQKDKKFWIFL